MLLSSPMQSEGVQVLDVHFAERQTANYCQRLRSDLLSKSVASELVFKHTEGTITYLDPCRSILLKARTHARQLKAFLKVPATGWSPDLLEKLCAMLADEQVNKQMTLLQVSRACLVQC